MFLLREGPRQSTPDVESARGEQLVCVTEPGALNRFPVPLAFPRRQPLSNLSFAFPQKNICIFALHLPFHGVRLPRHHFFVNNFSFSLLSLSTPSRNSVFIYQIDTQRNPKSSSSDCDLVLLFHRDLPFYCLGPPPHALLRGITFPGP